LLAHAVRLADELVQDGDVLELLDLDLEDVLQLLVRTARVFFVVVFVLVPVVLVGLLLL